MKLLHAGLLFCLAAAGGTPVQIKNDTPIPLRLRKTLSSATARTNEIVEFDVAEDIKSGEVVVIPKGSLAWGRVVEATPKARLARSGKLEIDISTACLADGSRVALRALASPAHESNSNESLFALPALPILLFVYGKDVSIPAGKAFTVYTAEPLNLDPERFTSKAPNRSCSPATVTPDLPAISAGLATVKAESVPSLGEVYVDGKFFGNAPATLHLPAGDHLISIRASGRKNWERVLSLTPGGETVVSATLDEAH